MLQRSAAQIEAGDGLFQHPVLSVCAQVLDSCRSIISRLTKSAGASVYLPQMSHSAFCVPLPFTIVGQDVELRLNPDTGVHQLVLSVQMCCRAYRQQNEQQL